VTFAEQVSWASGTTEPVVADVGIIPGRGRAAVELHARWGSGVYGCDPAAVLGVLRQATARRTTRPCAGG
jgi:hypothetical protein